MPTVSFGSTPQFLGLELEKLNKEFPDAFRFLAEKQEFSYGIGTLEKRGNPQGGIRWMPNLMWGSLFLVLGIGVWYFGKVGSALSSLEGTLKTRFAAQIR